MIFYRLSAAGVYRVCLCYAPDPTQAYQRDTASWAKKLLVDLVDEQCTWHVIWVASERDDGAQRGRCFRSFCAV